MRRPVHRPAGGAVLPRPGELARLWAELGTSDLSRATAYFDSMSDLPLLTAAGRPAAVNPDRRLRREARMCGWPVLTF